jgi:hypothetical protein
MNNHWLQSADKKRLYKEIDEIAMEVWGDDGTFADLLAALNDEQTDFLMNMLIKDFVGDPDDMSFGMELIAP